MTVHEWQSRLRARAAQLRWPKHVFILDSCDSTQDQAAALFTEHHSELAVIALHQSKGRGRLGRTWEQQPGASKSPLGLAITFALSPHHNTTWLPIRAALAAKTACDECLRPSDTLTPQVLVKWPNDLVTNTNHKLAGILVEKTSASAALLLGIGINVEHSNLDLPENLNATSLSLIAQRHIATLDVAETLFTHLPNWLTIDTDTIETAWKAADALSGTTRTFLHNNQTFTGTILDISPTRHIRLQTTSGIVTLPAATTRLA